jgi:hypothetical protein
MLDAERAAKVHTPRMRAPHRFRQALRLMCSGSQLRRWLGPERLHAPSLMRPTPAANTKTDPKSVSPTAQRLTPAHQ